MLQRLLVPLDGSARAERAIPIAARLARASNGTIAFVQVLPPLSSATSGDLERFPEPETSPDELTDAAHSLADSLETYKQELAGINTEITVATGLPAETILSTARLKDVQLIVLCQRGTRGVTRWLSGSVTQHLVRQSAIPLLALNEHGTMTLHEHTTQPVRVLVPLECFAGFEPLLHPVIHLFEALQGPVACEIHLLHVVDLSRPEVTERDAGVREQQARQALHRVARRLCEELPLEVPLTLTASVVVGPDPARAILDETQRATREGHGYDLLALMTHGRKGWQRLMMGSVTERLLGTLSLPMLIVPWMQETSTVAPEGKQADTGQHRQRVSVL